MCFHKTVRGLNFLTNKTWDLKIIKNISVCLTASLRPVVQENVPIFVFDPESSGGVAGFLSAVGIDRLHGAVWILPPLVLGRVDLFLPCVEMYLLGAVPEKRLKHC